MGVLAALISHGRFGDMKICTRVMSFCFNWCLCCDISFF